MEDLILIINQALGLPQWAGWVASFAFLEWEALRNDKPGDTLSAWIRRIFGFSKSSYVDSSGGFAKTKGIRQALFWLFQAWFIPHIATDWW